MIEEAEYSALTYDPVGVSKILDINLNRKYDLDKQGKNPASDKQINMLRHLGVTENLDCLSKWGAIKMIDKIMKRKDQGLASPGQVKALLSSGVEADLARSLSASSALNAIKEIDATTDSSLAKETIGRLAS